MDHNVPAAITNGLRIRGVDVLTAFEDGRHTTSDRELLDRATELDRVLFSRDDDLIVEAVRRQTDGQLFSGVIYSHQPKLSIGETIKELELIARVAAGEELQNQVHFLPL